MFPVVQLPERVRLKLLIVTALIRYRSNTQVSENGIASTLESLQLFSGVILRLDYEQ